MNLGPLVELDTGVILGAILIVSGRLRQEVKQVAYNGQGGTLSPYPDLAEKIFTFAINEESMLEGSFTVSQGIFDYTLNVLPIVPEIRTGTRE